MSAPAAAEQDDDAPPVAAMLAALAVTLRETVLRLDAASGGVTEKVLKRGEAAHDLVMALQDFDRLQQELLALQEAIAHCVAGLSGGARTRDPIETMGLADLKAQLKARARHEAILLAGAGGADEIF